jgi:16S rRNA (guanine1207-N2)-methyltransferase
MARSRLTTAIARGELSLPEGEVAVLRPPVGYDLSALPRGAVRIVTGFRPDADWWEDAGLPVTQTLSAAAAVVVVAPRARRLARDMIARACAAAPLVIVDGARTDGVDGLWREVRGRIGEVPVVTRAHGRLFWFATPGHRFADWAAPPPAPGADGFVTTAGVFSDGAIDRGSALLAAALPARLPARMADLGAGWGYLARAVLSREGVESLDLIEADALALDCARQNVTDPRARFLWEDATRWRPPVPYDGIVTNPPFHQTRAADPGLGRAFIASAAAMLAPHGQLWLVANRHLPYEAVLADCFRVRREVGGDAAFKLIAAERPKHP